MLFMGKLTKYQWPCSSSLFVCLPGRVVHICSIMNPLNHRELGDKVCNYGDTSTPLVAFHWFIIIFTTNKAISMARF